MDGIIVVNKPKGCTSHDVVYKIKKLFNEKVGHTGTLDPNATGVLPILVGKGTGLSEFLINHDKKYIATLKLGVRTDTADVEGNVIEEKEVDVDLLTESNVKDVLNSLTGKQMQKPPMYSAIKINGKKLYEYARSGKTVDIPEREIEIYELNLIEIDIDNKIIKFEVSCSKGTYIRTVCENVAGKLNTVGYMMDLCRTKVGEFNIEDSVTIEQLENDSNCSEFLISIEEFFTSKDSIQLNQKQLNQFLNGVMISVDLQDDIVCVYDEYNSFIGIGICKNKYLKRKIVI